jgi:hypothetical protein
MDLNDGNISNNLVQGGTSVVLVAYLTNTIMEMIPWLIAAIPLLIGDLYFGCKNVACHGGKLRLTKALSMTIDKAFSYVCWILISTTLSVAFSVDVLKYIILGFIYFREVISCFRNYMNSKGYNVNEIELFRLLWRFVIKNGREMADDASKIITKEESDNNKDSKQ